MSRPLPPLRGLDLLLDANGNQIRNGDLVKIDDDMEGIVVCSIDTGEFAPEFPAAEWAYLKSGIMVRTHEVGLVHVVSSAGVRRLSGPAKNEIKGDLP
jgi:hypothetical protein